MTKKRKQVDFLTTPAPLPFGYAIEQLHEGPLYWQLSAIVERGSPAVPIAQTRTENQARLLAFSLHSDGERVGNVS